MQVAIHKSRVSWNILGYFWIPLTQCKQSGVLSPRSWVSWSILIYPRIYVARYLKSQILGVLEHPSISYNTLWNIKSQVQGVLEHPSVSDNTLWNIKSQVLGVLEHPSVSDNTLWNIKSQVQGVLEHPRMLMDIPNTVQSDTLSPRCPGAL